jgi:hypothetical protein
LFADPHNAHISVASGAETTVPYTRLSQLGNSCVYENLIAAVGNPRVMKLSHSVVRKGDAKANRHLARMEAFVVVDGVEDRNLPISAYTVLDIPLLATASQRTTLFRHYIGMLRGSSGDVVYDDDPTYFWDRLIAGES